MLWLLQNEEEQSRSTVTAQMVCLCLVPCMAVLSSGGTMWGEESLPCISCATLSMSPGS